MFKENLSELIKKIKNYKPHLKQGNTTNEYVLYKVLGKVDA